MRSLYTDAVMPAPEALAVIAAVVGVEITDAGTADAFVVLPSGSTARVEVAKFGDETPIAIDVSDDRDDHARSSADGLAALLRETLGWLVTAG